MKSFLCKESMFGFCFVGVFLSHFLEATPWTVNSTSGEYSGSGNSGSLLYCLWNAEQNDSITVQSGLGTIVLTQSLPPFRFSNISFDGQGVTIDGQNAYSAFAVITPGTQNPASSTAVSISNVTIHNALSQGGAGGPNGGGGTGGGGALYVEQGAYVEISSMTMQLCSAVGGNGGDNAVSGFCSPGGGGGGYGGGPGGYGGGGGGGHAGGGSAVIDATANGVNSVSYTYGGGSGGDLGQNTDGACSPQMAGSSQNYQGAVFSSCQCSGGGGAGSGGDGASAGALIDSGSEASGGSGGNGLGLNNFGGGGGGFGNDANGGNGTGAGGGGGSGGYCIQFGCTSNPSFSGNGGSGGASGGGGGGAGFAGNGGSGGFGAGGGGGGDPGSSGTSLALGGSGALGNNNGIGAGGGGSGLGGAVFVQNGGFLSIGSNTTFSGNSVTAGAGGGGPNGLSGGNGSALGPDIFLRSGGTVIVTATAPLTLYSIASDQGAGGGSGGGLTMQGSSTLMLDLYEIDGVVQDTNYTGTTLISSGTIQAGAINAFSPNSPVQLATTGAPELNLNSYDNTIPGLLDFPISSSNSIQDSDSSVALGSGILTLVVPQSTSSIYSGVVEGTGGLVVSGIYPYVVGSSSNSIQTLNGDNTYTGPTTISSGVLVLNGTNATSLITVDSGGCLSGSATYPTSDITVNSGGTNNIGNSSGVLHLILGDYTLNPGSTLSITKDAKGTSLGVIGGSATINDATLFLTVTPDIDLIQFPSFTFLEVAGGVSGSGFSFVESNLFFITGDVTLVNGDFVLQPHFRQLSTLVSDANAKSVGNALTQIFSSKDSSFIPIAESFRGLAGSSELNKALDEMQPALFKGVTISQENNMVRVQDALSYRFQDQLNRVHCISVKSSADRKQTECSRDNHMFHVWIDGLGDNLHQGHRFYAGSSHVGYQTNMGGVVAGVEDHFASYFTAGIMGAYTNSLTKWNKDQGKEVDQTGYAGVYLSALGDLFYGNASVIGGWSHFHGHRNILYPGVDLAASNSHGGAQILSHLDSGLNLGWKGFTVRPFDSLDYISQMENSFTESGAGLWNLHVQKSNAILLRNELGLQFAGCFCIGEGTWSLSPKISWVREVRIKGSHYKAEFEGTDVPFVVTGYFPDRSLVSPGVILSGMMWKDLLSLELYYNGEFAYKYSNHSYGGQLRYGF